MKRSALKIRVIAAFALLIFVPVTTLFLYETVSSASRAREQIVSNARMMAGQYVYDLDARLSAASIVMSQLVSSTDMRTVIGDSEKRRMDGDTYLSLLQVQKTISVLASSSGVRVYSVCLTNNRSIIHQVNNTRFRALDDTLLEQEWFKAAVRAGGLTAWQGIQTEGVTKIPVLSASCSIRDNVSLGIVGAINVAFYAGDIFTPAAQDDDVMLVYYQPQTRVLYSRAMDEEELNDFNVQADALINSGESSAIIRMGGQERLLVAGEKGRYGWTALLALPAGSAFSALNQSTMILILVLAGCVALMILFLLQLYKRLLLPLEDAMNFINVNTPHSVNLATDARGYPELRILRENVSSLVEGNATIKENLARANLQKKMSRLKTLQLQINPHFLYNTLNSIKIFSDTGRNGEVSALIYNLVHLLSACMDRSGTRVTVREELETLNRYLSIQKAIYGNRVRFTVEAKEELSGCLVPNFILQPIVENALQHGMDESKDEPFIRVRDEKRGDALLFIIEDNGVGISQERLRSVEEDMRAEDESGHIGLRSVHQRIRLTCGEGYGISIRSREGEGSVFTVRLPYILDETGRGELNVQRGDR